MNLQREMGVRGFGGLKSWWLKVLKYGFCDPCESCAPAGPLSVETAPCLSVCGLFVCMTRVDGCVRQTVVPLFCLPNVNGNLSLNKGNNNACLFLTGRSA